MTLSICNGPSQAVLQKPWIGHFVSRKLGYSCTHGVGVEGVDHPLQKGGGGGGGLADPKNTHSVS